MVQRDEGAWTGTEYGLGEDSSAGTTIQPRMMLLTGEDAYEGLSAILFLLDTGTRWDVVGMVHPGELPPMPELPAE